VLAMVVSFVILIAGLQAMKTINVRQYPRSDIAAITVQTVYVARMRNSFADLSRRAGARNRRGGWHDYMQSQSTQGQSH